MFFCIYKSVKYSSVKYYENNKERLQIKARVRYQSLSLKKKKIKSDNVVVNDTKIYQKMKNKSLLSKEKIFIKSEKTPYYNYKKLLF